MLKKSLIALYIVIFCAALYFPISFFLNRAQENKATSGGNGGEETHKTSGENDKGKAPKEAGDENSTSGEEINVIEELLNDESPSTPGESSTENTNFYINVTPPDCTRECEPYKYDAKEFEYCQNVCGFSSPTATEDCGNLSGLEKDYCIKDIAIKEKNLKKCNEIEDIKIKETCQNRIQEEFIEGNF
jgi:hypothetical protein